MNVTWLDKTEKLTKSGEKKASRHGYILKKTEKNRKDKPVVSEDALLE